MNLPKSFKEYAVYCYKTNNTTALFSKSYFCFISIEGVVKMTSHVCFEFSKSVIKCDCFRRLRRDRLIFKTSNLGSRKPIWMHSGLAFRTSSGIGASGGSAAKPNPLLENEKHSTFKEKSSRFKFRPNQIAIQNNLANRMTNKFDLH